MLICWRKPAQNRRCAATAAFLTFFRYTSHNPLSAVLSHFCVPLSFFQGCLPAYVEERHRHDRSATESSVFELLYAVLAVGTPDP